MAGRRPLSEAKQEQIKQLARDGLTTREIANQVNVTFSTVARWLRKEGFKSDLGSAVTESFDFTDKIKPDETLVITWAQNATPPNRPFLNALLTYCKHNKARLIVIPGRYKNPTSIWTASQKNEEWWHKDLEPYLYNQRTSLNANLKLLGDISIQPTAVFPLSGMESLSQSESGIFGHPKLQMRVIPAPQNRLPKIITTTGAVTKENYTKSKAGKKGQFHHVYGAVVIEREGKLFHLRHINARSDGAFCDLDKAYYPDGSVNPSGPYVGLVLGDVHVDAVDEAVLKATFDKLIKRLNPKTLVLHDLLDAYAVNPHHLGNPFIKVSKRKSGRDNLQKEVQRVVEWLKKYADRPTVIVPSNHNEMFDRWLNRQDWRDDPENAEYYLETALFMVRGLKHDSTGTKVPDPLKYWVDRARLPQVRYLDRNQSFTLASIECGLHGHQGPNGVKGSLLNLSRLGAKVISGHSHTPGIEGGHYKTGTCTPLALEYTNGISTWLQSHVSIDPMGKRHIHTLVDGEFYKS